MLVESCLKYRSYIPTRSIKQPLYIIIVRRIDIDGSNLLHPAVSSATAIFSASTFIRMNALSALSIVAATSVNVGSLNFSRAVPTSFSRPINTTRAGRTDGDRIHRYRAISYRHYYTGENPPDVYTIQPILHISCQKTHVPRDSASISPTNVATTSRIPDPWFPRVIPVSRRTMHTPQIDTLADP